jgi:hypothetical protein
MREEIEDLELRVQNLENKLDNKFYWDIASFSIIGAGLIFLIKDIWEWVSKLLNF